MTDIDLTTAVPAALARLRAEGVEPSSDQLLETLGVDPAFSLRSTDGASVTLPTMDLVPGGTVGRFQVERTLGAGGMGRVLLAWDPELCRDVAVKVVLRPDAITDVQLRRFVAEARITSQLQHPNIVPVHEMGVAEDGQIYFVMKRVEGRSLRQVLEALAGGEPNTRREWTRHRLLTTFLQVCNAVAYAHDRAVIHRDLKPDNIMVGAFGEVLVMDWGVARVLDGKPESVAIGRIDGAELPHTLDGAAIGTPGYMSPEQAGGALDGLDPRSDVWCLGAILHELLTGKRAFVGTSALALIFAAAKGPAPDPRERAPDASIPDEIADVAMRAMARHPEDRWQSAAELAQAVEDFLEGSARRAAAERHLVEADDAWMEWRGFCREEASLAERASVLQASLEPWASRQEKAELHAALDQQARLARLRAERFEDLLSACEKALSQDPANLRAHERLAEAHFARFEQAERAGDAAEQDHHRRRVLRHDNGRYTDRLLGAGALTLHTDPPGATVLIERYVREGLIWPRTERRVLGTTPLDAVPLERGSYRLILQHPDMRDTVYPVEIGRGRHWVTDEPVPLFAEHEIGAGWIYVPAGPCVLGGDAVTQDTDPRREVDVPGFFLQEFPTTMGAYCAFINGLARVDPEEAWRRVPREESGLKEHRGQYWDRPPDGARYVVPEVDKDGDRWLPQWPVFAVSWFDALAMGEWLSGVHGVPITLPTQAGWEKAARGVDGRPLPWGDRFDATLCKMRDSRPGRPTPEPVGLYPDDVSPYGVRDTVGTIREWTLDPHFGGDPERRTVRGGGWDSAPKDCRVTFRYGYLPSSAGALDGFRLARGIDAVFSR